MINKKSTRDEPSIKRGGFEGGGSNSRRKLSRLIKRTVVCGRLLLEFADPRRKRVSAHKKMAAPLMQKLSESLGSPEPAVRLILSILIGEFPRSWFCCVLAWLRGFTALQGTGPSPCNCHFEPTHPLQIRLPEWTANFQSVIIKVNDSV